MTGRQTTSPRWGTLVRIHPKRSAGMKRWQGRDDEYYVRAATRPDWHAQQMGGAWDAKGGGQLYVDGGPSAVCTETCEHEPAGDYGHMLWLIRRDAEQFAHVVVTGNRLNVDPAEQDATAAAIADWDETGKGGGWPSYRDEVLDALIGLHHLTARPDIAARLTTLGYTPWQWAWAVLAADGCLGSSTLTVSVVDRVTTDIDRELTAATP